MRSQVVLGLKWLAVLGGLAACGSTSGCRRSTAGGSTKPTSCIQDVVVGPKIVCFLVRAGYYVCRGSEDQGIMGNGELPEAPPELRGLGVREYIAFPHRFTKLRFGLGSACGTDAQRRLWCWGGGVVEGEATQDGVPTVQTRFGEVDDFSVYSALCTRRGDAVRCKGLRNAAVVEVPGLPSGVRHIGAGLGFACAATDHAVYCFGNMSWANNRGSPHSTSHNLDPSWLEAVRIEGPDLDLASLHVGTMSGCVLTRQGTVYCFGSNDLGGLGNGQAIACEEPCPEHNFRRLHEVTALGSDVKELGLDATACALKRDGSVWCWGYNRDRTVSSRQRELTVALRDDGPKVVVVEPTPLEVTMIGRDNVHLHMPGTTCVTKASGAVWCWGDNSRVQIGNCDGQPWCPPTEMKVPCPP